MRRSNTIAICFCVLSVWFSSVGSVNLSARGSTAASDYGHWCVVVKLRDSAKIVKGGSTTALEAEFGELVAKSSPLTILPFAEQQVNSIESERFAGDRVVEYSTEAEAVAFVALC